MQFIEFGFSRNIHVELGTFAANVDRIVAPEGMAGAFYELIRDMIEPVANEQCKAPGFMRLIEIPTYLSVDL